MARFSERDKTNQLVSGNLIQADTDLLALKAFVDGIVAATNEHDAATQAQNIRSLIGSDVEFIGTVHRQVGDTMGDLYQTARGADGYFLTADREKLEAIHNAWERIRYPGFTQFLDDARKVYADPSKNALDLVPTARNLARDFASLRQRIGLFTIDTQVHDRLRPLLPGTPLDFLDTFKEQLPDAADRATALKQLSLLREGIVGGLVDVQHGMIYKVGNRARRWWSYALVTAPALLGIILLGSRRVVGQERFDQWIGQFIPNFSTAGYADDLWLLYAVLMLGVAVHIVKTAYDQSVRKLPNGKALAPLDELPLWIHVREGRFMLTTFVGVLLFVVLIGVGKSTLELTVVTAFFAGYTVDSFADVLLQRSQRVFSSQASAVQTKLLTLVAEGGD